MIFCSSPAKRELEIVEKITALCHFTPTNIAGKTNALPGMNFGGKISGNSFAGNANGIKTQGGFFGENAQEMTGLCVNEADQARGSFGGIKQ